MAFQVPPNLPGVTIPIVPVSLRPGRQSVFWEPGACACTVVEPNSSDSVFTNSAALQPRLPAFPFSLWEGGIRLWRFVLSSTLGNVFGAFWGWTLPNPLTTGTLSPLLLPSRRPPPRARVAAPAHPSRSVPPSTPEFHWKCSLWGSVVRFVLFHFSCCCSSGISKRREKLLIYTWCLHWKFLLNIFCPSVFIVCFLYHFQVFSHRNVLFWLFKCF